MSLTGDTGREFPFLTKEPEVYQGDFVTVTVDAQDRYFIARKGDKWRYDVYRGVQPAMSAIHSDRMYAIDHQKKTYWEMPGQAGGTNTINDLTRNLFRGYEHRDFDEMGREGSLIKYKVRNSGGSKGDIFVTFDTASGLVIKDEFVSTDKQDPGFVYEIKNLKMEVDDGVFDIPQGYKKVAAK